MTTSAERLIAPVPLERQRDGISMLVIEHDARGWFLFGHSTLGTPSVFDYWYESAEGAQRHAESYWGVLPGDWRSGPPDRC